MPQPHNRNRLTPEDLARLLASQIASKQVPKPRHRLRDSVLVGRLIAGTTGLAVVAAVLAVVLVGVNWWTQRSTAAEVLATEVTPSGERDSSGSPSIEDLSGIHMVQQLGGFRLAGALPTSVSSPLPELPAPKTTLSGSWLGPATTQQGLSPSVDAPSTAAPTTAPPGPPVTSAPTTTTDQPSTTQPTTTTTLPGTTTTTIPATTTTCAGNSGSGNGRNCR